jgi:hypothetical protein
MAQAKGLKEIGFGFAGGWAAKRKRCTEAGARQASKTTMSIVIILPFNLL